MSNVPDVVGVVVAAGRSTRLGGPVPKQFMELAGKTILARSIEVLASRPAIRGVVVVLAPEELEGDREFSVRSIPGVLSLVAGGTSRARSVRCGLEAARAATHVLVHDAARPMVDPRVVDSVVAATIRHGAAIPLLGVSDTVKEEDDAGFVARTLDRSTLRLAQTPQGARTDWLLAALDRAESEGIEVTDEAHALERAGYKVAVVPGDRKNVKITTSEDLAEARDRLASPPGLRVGTGFDIHRFGGDRSLVLGGVTFPGEPGLLGHSDADVVLHAAMDAILGALAMGDIGEHFPPSDARFAGAASSGLAADVARLAREAGFEIVNLDLSLLAERPRIRERADAMRQAIAACLGISADTVGLKATTLEKVGSLGRGEGIACQAVVLLARKARDR